MREQVQRGAAAQRDRGHERRASSPVCAIVFLIPSASSTMPGDHRQVQVGVGVARQPRPLVALRRARSRRSATSATTSKYAHHSAAATRDAEHARPRSAPASTGRPGRADADRDDRLAERDDHDQPVALGEVRGRRRCQPATPDSDGPTYVDAAAPRTQSAPCSQPSKPRRPRSAARRRRAKPGAMRSIADAHARGRRGGEDVDARGAARRTRRVGAARTASASLPNAPGTRERGHERGRHRARASPAASRPPRG